jgi:uncharacterized tellurite resistance protein B-like protein
MTMTRKTTRVTPTHIGPTQALARLQEVKDLNDNQEYVEAAQERDELAVDVLYSIHHASGYADKAEMRRLAGIALEAFEIPGGSTE